MSNQISAQNLAEKVKAMRQAQNAYFRIPKENKQERQVAIRVSKARESEVDKLVSLILNPEIF